MVEVWFPTEAGLSEHAKTASYLPGFDVAKDKLSQHDISDLFRPAPGTVDSFAIYIIPTDDWYIIPYAVVGERNANVYFRPGMKGQKYEKYREAWHLLVDATKGRAEGLLEIRACSEPDESQEDCSKSAQVNPPARSRSMVRRMFRTLFRGGGSGVKRQLAARD